MRNRAREGSLENDIRNKVKKMGSSVSDMRNRERKNGFLRKLHKEQSDKEWSMGYVNTRNSVGSAGRNQQ
jgi:hypothetical protein